MPEYSYPDDGKIHTRYTELTGCSVDGVKRVAKQRVDGHKFSTEATEFGGLRHDMFAEESHQTKRVPKHFASLVDDEVIGFIEYELAIELADGVIVHSTIDAATTDLATIFDYKTAVCKSDEPEELTKLIKELTAKYQSSKQLHFYAYQISSRGYRVNRGIFLVEVWDKDRTKILATFKVVRQLRLGDISQMRHWALRGSVLLKNELKQLGGF